MIGIRLMGFFVWKHYIYHCCHHPVAACQQQVIWKSRTASNSVKVLLVLIMNRHAISSGDPTLWEAPGKKKQKQKALKQPPTPHQLPLHFCIFALQNVVIWVTIEGPFSQIFWGHQTFAWFASSDSASLADRQPLKQIRFVLLFCSFHYFSDWFSVLPVPARISPGCSSFPLQSKDKWISPKSMVIGSTFPHDFDR